MVHGNLGIPAPPCGPYPVAGLRVRGRFVARWAMFEAGLELGGDTQQRIAERGAGNAITSQRVEALPATRARVRAIGSLWAYIYTVKFATPLRGCATRGSGAWEARTWYEALLGPATLGTRWCQAAGSICGRDGFRGRLALERTGWEVAMRLSVIAGGCASIGVEVGFERHSKKWPACRPSENILPPPLTRVAGRWDDVLELAMWGS